MLLQFFQFFFLSFPCVFKLVGRVIIFVSKFLKTWWYKFEFAVLKPQLELKYKTYKQYEAHKKFLFCFLTAEYKHFLNYLWIWFKMFFRDALASESKKNSPTNTTQCVFSEYIFTFFDFLERVISHIPTSFLVLSCSKYCSFFIPEVAYFFEM